MNFMFYISLFVFGSLFGSFASVLIYRLHFGESGILNGRSHCPKCNHTLGFLDLIPIFSWLFNKGKCKYCKEKVSIIYPILELSTGILFILIGYFLIDFQLILGGNINEIIKMFFWLTIGFITILYFFYDILFLEIHEGIMGIGIFIALIGVIFQSLGILNIIPTLPLGELNYINIISIFIVIFSIIGLYIIMLKEYSNLIDSLILLGIISLLYCLKTFFSKIELLNLTAINALIGALIIFLFFYIQYLIGIFLHYLEKKKKNQKDYRFADGIIGGGDFRIAIFIGLLLGTYLSPIGLMITYLAGSIISIFVLFIQKLKTKSQQLNTQIPFGPFLAIGFFITIFYQEQLSNLLKIYFL